MSSLRKIRQRDFRRWINEPDACSSTRMRLVINNLHPRGPWQARAWITDWPSQNQSSPMRAERAKPKSCKDDGIVAQGKRSAALGYGCKTIPSFLPSGLARQRRARPEGRKEVGLGGSLPRAAASAVLPWAIILLPLRGAGKANQRAGGDGGASALFRAGRLWPTALQHGR